MLLKLNEESWNITHEDYNLSSNDYKTLLRAWSSTFRDISRPQMKVLIINGADQVIKNAFNYALDITICDPFAYDLCEPEYEEILATETFKNQSDICGYNHKLMLIDDTFQEALKDNSFKNKFDIIVIANSYEKGFKDVTSKVFLENCYLLLRDHGSLCLQLPNSLYTSNPEFKIVLDYYFSEVGKKLRFLTGYNQDVALTTYRKFTNLV